jgi:putative Holliday junction resolvase
VRYLGIDYGQKRIGLALSDPDGKIARPHGVFERDNPLADVRRLCLFAVEEGVDEVVIGHPLREDGTPGETVAAVGEFLAALKSHLDLPVHLLDERYTTRAAEDALREAGLDARAVKKKVDAVAAALILQAFLKGLDV